MLKLVAFDLDDTLAPSKTPMGDDMVTGLLKLLETIDVCIISGGTYGQFQTQVIARLPAGPSLRRMHLMPTCGTQYYRMTDDVWTQVYSEPLSADERRQASDVLRDAATRLGLWESEDDVFGDRIEDRGTQITFSALGQQAPVDRKHAWDPDGEKRRVLRDEVQELLPDLEVRAGGSTSIDITRRGIDKAYGMGTLMKSLDLAAHEVHFIGDRLEPGGNDYPVRSLDISVHQVEGPEHTLRHLDELMNADNFPRRST
ncbi:MAG: family hydrolase [Marmoricola sp.]|nr:family hydrolase [Marmoricola sp.]